MRSLLFLILLVAALKTDQIHCEPVDAAANAVLEMNRYRRLYAVPFLNESAKLRKGAEAYAHHLTTLNVKDQQLHEDMLKKEDYIPTIDHTDYPPSDPHNTKYTENICEFVHPRISFPIEYWTRKGAICYKNVKQRKGVCQSLSDKFTALYWRNSTEVGVGLAQKHKAKGDRKRWIMVIRFSPPGNQPGEFRDNIFLEPEEDTDKNLKGSTSGERQEPVSWIYVVLFIQNYLLINWLTRITN